jgi:hypothetical protein
MKTILQRLTRHSFTLAIAGTALLSAVSTHAVNYAGNGNAGFGGDIANGILSLTDDGTNINGKVTCGNGNNMYNVLVIYIDTGAGGGFSTTTNFNDFNDQLRDAISGAENNTGNRSVLTFTNGFAPQYAVALCPGNGNNFGGIWQLANGGNNSLGFLDSVNLAPVGTTSGPFTFSIKASDLGLASNSPKTIRIFGTYISTTAYRSSEAIAGNLFGAVGQGWNPFVQTAYATYNFDTPPPPTFPVTFSVDMTEQIAIGAFNPANGDTVYCGGSFQTNPFAFTDFPLTPTVGNTNIYTGTYQDPNPTNTAEQYKFSFYSVAGATNAYDSDPNRPFTLQAGGQVIPLVYFNNLPASPSATTNYTTFQIDMTPQLYLGHFSPANGDQIEVFGTFQSSHYSPGFFLTNNPSISASNVYSGTFADGNYPGTVEYYKYVIYNPSFNGGYTNYESGANRILSVPTNSTTLPIAFYSGVTNVYSTPVTFQVDMTVPIAIGEVNPANGDTVGCAGTFQTNSFGVGTNGFTLSPSPGNTNIYVGTYIDRNPPGTAEQYKFVINTNGGGTAYEQPASTGGNNRYFVLPSTASTNPLVYWNDNSPDSVVLSSTTITFTINMAGAVDLFGVPFDPANDVVMVDGNFYQAQGQWQVFNHAADQTVVLDYPNNILQSTGTGEVYSLSFTIPAGSPIGVQYKYGIVHNSGNLANTNVDNEAPFGANHFRYIRVAGGSYNFPVDIFGLQRTNQAAATEPPFGALAIGSPSGGIFPINWLGLRGVHLQSSTNLLSWRDETATDGLNSTNWPISNYGTRFFRLIQP